MIFSRILIPTDFSPRCLGAARYSIPIAERFHSQIVFLHVEPPSGEGPEMNAGHERLAKRLRDFLPAAFARLNVKRIVRAGDPAAEIVRCAEDERSNLILMPTHGYGPFRRFLVGSTTAKVLHDAVCPVWTGAHLDHGPPAEWLKPEVVICAVDAVPENENVLRWGAKAAAKFDADLLLVHVLRRLESPGEGHYSREFHGVVLAEANRKLEQLQLAAGTRAQVLIDEGNIADAVSKAVEREKANLLVIGRGSPNTSGRLGANTYDIIRESRCPVVSI